MSNSIYIALVNTANDLLGPLDDRVNVNPEYERAMVELIANAANVAYPTVLRDLNSNLQY